MLFKNVSSSNMIRGASIMQTPLNLQNDALVAELYGTEWKQQSGLLMIDFNACIPMVSFVVRVLFYTCNPMFPS
ncbi:Cox19 family protein (CHCH motif) [Zea mays]|nr:Cox19 family protein (CHCH motif) [Zea mays]